MLTIACPYSNRARWARREATFRNLPSLGRPWTYECLDDTTYDAWFLKKWAEATTDLLIIEHDNVPTRDMVESLDVCPHPICVQDYQYSDGLSVHRLIVENRAVDRIVGEEWTDLWGFGVVRFKLDLIKSQPLSEYQIGKQSKNEGPSLDSRVSSFFHSLGMQAHVHYPTSKHNHSTDIQWYGGIQTVADMGSDRVLRRLERDVRRLDTYGSFGRPPKDA